MEHKKNLEGNILWLSPKKILVIGGTGFVGPEIVDVLVRTGCEVTLLNRGTRKIANTVHLQADRNRVDELRDVSDIASSCYDAIIDLCCYNANQSKLAWTTFSSQTNHWIYLSSAAVYKNAVGKPAIESDQVGGANIWGAYGVGKFEAEQFLIDSSSTAQSPKVTIFRPPYIYGPNNNNDRETFVWVRALNDKPVFIPGDGQTPIQFLHVSDLARAIKLSIQTNSNKSSPKVYNIAADECPTLSEWVSVLSEISGVKDPGIVAGEFSNNLFPRQYFPFRDYPCWVNSRKIKTDLNWFPYYTMKLGFHQTYRSYPDGRLKHFPMDSNMGKIEDRLCQRYLKLSGECR